MFEMDATPSDLHFVIGTVGKIDDFGSYLRREAEQICRPRVS
jgi:hypothetical protein